MRFVIPTSSVLLLWMLLSPVFSVEPEKPPFQSRYRSLEVGESFELSELRVTLNDAHYISQPAGTGRATPGESTPDVEARLFLIVDITIENRGRENLMVYESSEIRLRDEKGYAYEHIGLRKTKGDLGNKIIAGDKNRGEVAFVITEGAKGLKVLIDLSDIGSRFATAWSIPPRSASNTASLGWDQMQEAGRSVYKDIYYLRRKLTSAFGKNDISESRDLPYRIYFPSNILSEKGTFVDNAQEGLFEVWNAFGKLAMSADYRKGKAEKWVLYAYHPNLSLKSTLPYIKGQRHGVEIHFHDTGTNRLKTVVWNKGQQTGENKIYYETGKLKAEWTTRDGKLNGNATFFAENGQPVRAYSFKDGKIQEPVKTFDGKGKAGAPERFQPDSDPFFKLMAPQ